MARNKSGRGAADEFADFDMIPVAGVELAGRVRNWSWMIVGGLVLGGLSLLVSVVAALSGGGSTGAPVASSSDAKSAGLAGAAAKAWLNGQPIPGSATDACAGERAPFDQVASASWQRMTPTAMGGEVHRFVVVADDHVWNLSVTIRRDTDEVGDSFPVVDGCPTVAPFVEHDPVDPEAPWAGWPAAVSAPDRFVKQADEWADAYFSDSPEALYRVTADTDPSRQYQPVGALWQVTRTSVDYLSVNAAKTAALGHVTVVTDRGVFGFDVLFGDPAAALPPVVAWGPVGSGTALAPYVNASAKAVPVPAATTTTVPAPAETTTTVAATTSTTSTVAAVPAPVETTTTVAAAPAG